MPVKMQDEMLWLYFSDLKVWQSADELAWSCHCLQAKRNRSTSQDETLASSAERSSSVPTQTATNPGAALLASFLRLEVAQSSWCLQAVAPMTLAVCRKLLSLLAQFVSSFGRQSLSPQGFAHIARTSS
jgi:hypothetical protein